MERTDPIAIIKEVIGLLINTPNKNIPPEIGDGLNAVLPIVTITVLSSVTIL